MHGVLSPPPRLPPQPPGEAGRRRSKGAGCSAEGCRHLADGGGDADGETCDTVKVSAMLPTSHTCEIATVGVMLPTFGSVLEPPSRTHDRLRF